MSLSTSRIRPRALALMLAPMVILAACGSSGSEATNDPVIIVTSNVLADVVDEIVGAQVEVVSLMAPGTNPHTFQISAKQAAQLRDADLVISVGGGLEAGLSDALESAESDGVTIVEAIDGVNDLHAAPEHDHGAEDDHDPEPSEATDDHDAPSETEGTPIDPHFFTDPVRMAEAIEAISAELSTSLDGVDVEQLTSDTARFLSELGATHSEMTAELAVVEPKRRVLVTNHDVFGYFAERFDFEILGVVFESTSVSDAVNAAGIAELATAISEHDLPAIFADASSQADVMETVAREAGENVTVELLYSESLTAADGDAPTYLEMLMFNARAIATSLGG